tara:strand:+ start:933 stop:1520 length:588 start_codon:yes stop_codon:yes gene_type:complete
MKANVLKKVYGIGINDAGYTLNKTINGKQKLCPFYSRWYSMIKRCYDPVFWEKRPTYEGCTVCSEWLLFSNFKCWMERQEWEGRSLDKDIIKINNKVYSPENCIFVTTEINNLLTNVTNNKGSLPIGVKRVSAGYKVECSRRDENLYLGFFKTKEEASKTYWKFKKSVILGISKKEKEPLRTHLINLANNIKSSL